MYNKKANFQLPIKIWFFTMIMLVFLMIMVGGLTRLTDSGLSITEWELFKGIFPPLSKDSWNTYFNLYKEIPQFEMIYPNMSMEEFKIIFYWEYFHRLLGRIIGLAYLIPLIFFSINKVFDKKILIILYFLFFFICAQVIMGW